MQELELHKISDSAIPAAQEKADQLAFDYDCGACAAACPNASASLFVAAKISHLGLLPQGQPERNSRVQTMLAQMDIEGFGFCSNHRECEVVCPKEINIDRIARMNRDMYRSLIHRG